MLGIGLIFINLWLLALLLLFLHWQTQRWGFGPLLVVVGGLTGIVQQHFGIYVAPTADVILFVTSNVLVPLIVMTILVIYVVNGSLSARIGIYSILFVSLAVLGMELMMGLYLSLPEGGSTFGLTPVSFTYNLHVTVASIVAFAADMFVIAIAYQGTHNQWPQLPEWLVVGVALFIGLWTDSIVFNLLSSLNVVDFSTHLPGDVLGKTLSAAILWPPAAIYIVRFAPRMPEYVGNTSRPIFDIVLGSLQQIRMALARTESALVEVENKRRQEAIYFRQISDNINEALWLTNGDETEILYVNPQYEKVWGRSASALYKSSAVFLESIHPDDRERVRQSLPRRAALTKIIEYRIIRPDGSVRWLRDRAFPIVDSNGQISEVAGITEDITDQREQERQEVALKVEQQRVKYLREFIAEATHDLKTPLTALNLKIYRLSKIPGDGSYRQLTTELSDLTGHLGKIIDDILTLSRLDSAVELQPITFDVSREIQKHCDLLRSVIEKKSLNLIVDLEITKSHLAADPEDLSRAFGNLIDNAVHYTPNNGTVTIHTTSADDQLVFSVSDTGIGIPKAEQSQIFERFYRASNARSVEANGTGLGLAIVKKIVEQHNGQLELISKEQQGTTFTVRLPLAP